jgi:hypothetical protein
MSELENGLNDNETQVTDNKWDRICKISNIIFS